MFNVLPERVVALSLFVTLLLAVLINVQQIYRKSNNKLFLFGLLLKFTELCFGIYMQLALYIKKDIGNNSTLLEVSIALLFNTVLSWSTHLILIIASAERYKKVTRSTVIFKVLQVDNILYTSYTFYILAVILNTVYTTLQVTFVIPAADYKRWFDYYALLNAGFSGIMGVLDVCLNFISCYHFVTILKSSHYDNQPENSKQVLRYFRIRNLIVMLITIIIVSDLLFLLLFLCYQLFQDETAIQEICIGGISIHYIISFNLLDIIGRIGFRKRKQTAKSEKQDKPVTQLSSVNMSGEPDQPGIDVPETEST